MKLTAFSLKKTCIMVLIRNCHCMNLTILPRELAIEIMEAIRDPSYNEHEVAIRHLTRENLDRHMITEFLYQNEPTNPILQYHMRGSEVYVNSSTYRERCRVDLLRKYGAIYDESRDVYIRAYCNFYCIGLGDCYLEEQLPAELLRQMEDQNAITGPIMVRMSMVHPSNKY